MTLFSLDDLKEAQAIVRRRVPHTPVYAWPLLAKRTGVDVYVKHENHTPIGAFKVRGGLIYLKELTETQDEVRGIVTATRGNHGQSVALAASAHGLACVVVVPEGNSVEKNRAMEAFGAELIVDGTDFDESKYVAERIAGERGFHFMPSFHPALVKGVATYALELLTDVEGVDAVYVPIGLGSGICGVITARDLLGLKTEVVGVVADNAPGYALSYEAGECIPTNTARTFADGVATREPNPQALQIIRAGASRIERIGEDDIAAAMRAYYEDTHNVIEGAGAAPLAALIRDKERYQGRRVAVVASGGNVDTDVFMQVLGGETPEA